nr:RNA-directed DNA polymerase, eukaryota, reverse transcriptase zinc-binding domain protein [Tanacetum cinerariifolium]
MSERTDTLFPLFPNLLNTPPSFYLEFCLDDLDRSRLILENTLRLGLGLREHLELCLFSCYMVLIVLDSEYCDVPEHPSKLRAIGYSSCHNTLGGLRRTWAHLGLVRMNGSCRCCLEIDIAKTYDTVDWKLLGKCLKTVKESMMEFSEISVGKIPMKYLGVPLITKRLGSTECKHFIDKVKGKVEDWKNKYLSYAVVKEIDKVLKGFLWCKGEIKRWKAKVDWKIVCSPKSQGGLGLRLFGKWNKVLLIKNLWNIAEGKTTLWVKWVNVIKLKGRSIWEIQEEYSDSWMWKTLLDLRVKVKRNIFKVLRDGKDTNFWVPMLNCQKKDKTKWKDSKGNLVDYTSKAV